MKMDWKKLQNGSDVRGVALEGIEGESVNLTPEVTKTIARAFVAWLHDKTQKGSLVMAVGVDSRISGPTLKQAFIDGVVECGVRIYDCGMASTPAMFMTTVNEHLKADASVMITASHLPFNRNGLKFFTPAGGLDKADIASILDLASTGASVTLADEGCCVPTDFMSVYCDTLVNYIREGADAADHDHPLQGMKIVVDAGNGAGGFFATKVLSQLGADTDGSQFLDPDGSFPNHIPNPENKEAMASVCAAVTAHHADLGIIFDTDVDRSAIVDKNGNPINRNALIALIASVILREHPGSTVVTDSVTSDGLTDFIKSRGGVHHRFRRGYKNVINEGIRLNNEGEECWLAIETSGHAALRENYFLDDGAYLVAKLLVEAARLKADGRELQDLIVDLRCPLESEEIRFTIHTDDFRAYGQKVLDEMLTAFGNEEGWEIVKPNYEGIRVACHAADEDGWFLLRQSLHDPVLPLNIESNVCGGVARIKSHVFALLARYSEVLKC